MYDDIKALEDVVEAVAWYNQRDGVVVNCAAAPEVADTLFVDRERADRKLGHGLRLLDDVRMGYDPGRQARFPCGFIGKKCLEPGVAAIDEEVIGPRRWL